MAGAIEPIEGFYRPGELVKFYIPELNLDEYLQIKEAAYESLRGLGKVNIKLTLESPQKDAVTALKDINSRLQKLESSVYQDKEGPVEKYISREEISSWDEDFEMYRALVQYPSDSLYLVPEFY